jgi:DNA polymerase-1
MIEDFEDLSGTNEVVDISIDAFGGLVMPKNGLVALIDADTIAFTACLATEVECTALPRDFYTEEEWSMLNIVDGVYWEIDLDLALQKAEEKIQRILDKTGCSSVELHFTGGRENFRYDVYPGYKAKRVDLRTPTGLNALKVMLCEKYNGTIHTKWEADDAVVYYRNEFPEKYIMCAVDKDVYNSVAGKHFNYYESGHYNIDMKWVEVSESTARMWPYLQAITGDKTDGISGCNGIGPKKVMKFISESMAEEELWEGVCSAYASKGLTMIEALMTMNAVNMNLLTEVDGELQIVLWHPDQV